MNEDWAVHTAGLAESMPRLHESRGVLSGGRWQSGTNVGFQAASVDGVDFSGVQFWAFAAGASSFDNCDFSGCRFEAGALGVGQQTRYRDCRFDWADLRSIDLGNVRFERCSFDQADIHDWAADAAEFVECRFAGRITESRFCGRPWGMWLEGAMDVRRRSNDFRANDFTDAELSGCDFVYAIDIGAQRWPSGPQYVRVDRWKARAARAMSAFDSWPPADRDEALITLAVYTEAGYEEQDEIFVNKWSLGTDPKLADRIWSVIASVL